MEKGRCNLDTPNDRYKRAEVGATVKEILVVFEQERWGQSSLTAEGFW